MYKKNSRSSNNGNEPLYSSAQVSDKDVDRFNEWLADINTDYETLLEQAADEGYRVTTKRDFNNGCYMCTFTQQDDRHLNGKIILVSRSDNPIEAFYLSAFKVFVMYAGRALPTENEKILWG